MKTYILVIPTHGLNSEQLSQNLAYCTNYMYTICDINPLKSRIAPFFIPHTAFFESKDIDNRIYLRSQMKLLAPLIDMISTNNNEVYFAPEYNYTCIGAMAMQLCHEYCVDTVELPASTLAHKTVPEYIPCDTKEH